jgi:3-oxoacyl-[acyl-carrier protein] reductase
VSSRSETRVALVTGSSRGLGSTIAERLARDGLAVAVNDVHGGERAGEVAEPIRARGGLAEAFGADVTDESQVAALVDAVAARLGSIDVLVVNATGPQPEAPLADVSWDDHLAQLEFFVKSPVLLGRAVLPACGRAGSVASSRSTPRSSTGRPQAGRRMRPQNLPRSGSPEAGRASSRRSESR